MWPRIAELSGLPEDRVRRMKPWMIGTSIEARLLPQTFPMDLAIWSKFQSAGKPVDYLETVEQQMGFLEKVFTAEELVHLVKHYEEERTRSQELLAAYKSGDEAALSRLIYDPAERKRNPRAYEVLLTGRNKAWLPRVERYLAEGGVFVAVGAGHLVGAEGLVAMLRKRGHQVTPLP
jgi:uncharacterized protein YbaP (TraB family)